MPEQPPRRRISDKDRRRWPDPALDQLSERVDDSAERLAAIDRRISEVRNDLAQTNERLARIERTLSESFERNFNEHKAVQQTTDKIAQNTASTWVTKAKDYALILSLLLMPLLTTYATTR